MAVTPRAPLRWWGRGRGPHDYSPSTSRGDGRAADARALVSGRGSQARVSPPPPQPLIRPRLNQGLVECVVALASRGADRSRCVISAPADMRSACVAWAGLRIQIHPWVGSLAPAAATLRYTHPSCGHIDTVRLPHAVPQTRTEQLPPNPFNGSSRGLWPWSRAVIEWV